MQRRFPEAALFLFLQQTIDFPIRCFYSECNEYADVRIGNKKET